ncbi:MAG: hypothetical protein EBY26_03815 [Microbacteriaceae bacterium]|nr:hypothetical protein [Microbacteriaceae bacterium]
MQERPKYWYERQAELNSAADRREFLRGYFGIAPTNRGAGPIAVGILSGALIASAMNELRRR